MRDIVGEKLCFFTFEFVEPLSILAPTINYSEIIGHAH